MPVAANFTPLDLEAELWALLTQIPHGRVTTYGRVAVALGSRQAARWVAEVVLRHAHNGECPCHRVVAVDGLAGGRLASRAAVARRRLRAEGWRVSGGRVALDTPFDAFCGDRPLAMLEARQSALAAHIVARAPARAARRVAALDVSYAGARGVAGYVLFDLATQEIIWTTTVEAPVRFPYLPGLLSYRELPLLSAALDAARRAERLADVYLVDGSGILHPRGLGSATHFGVEHDLPTIGLTKRLLAGRVDAAGPSIEGCQPIVLGENVAGVALRAPRGPGCWYVSPGHRMDVATAARIVIAMRGQGKLPTPLEAADRLSRAAARKLSREPASQGVDEQRRAGVGNARARRAECSSAKAASRSAP